MKLLDLSSAPHVTGLPSDAGSWLRPMLKAARRGWWYPDVPPLAGGLRGGQRATALLWHHDWIGNRFGGERITHVLAFPLFKALAVWQMLGQWTPLIFMGTERYAVTPWYFFTGHQDPETRNNTSAYYADTSEGPFLGAGRFREFAPEAGDSGLREALAFSRDGTSGGIDWDAFRGQMDGRGQPYMDHARRETFEASKLDWRSDGREHRAVQVLFAKLLRARKDARVKEEDPRHTQYKAWDSHERVFLLRRRASDHRELVALINLSPEPVSFTIARRAIDARGCGEGYIVAMDDVTREEEWTPRGRYSLWLDTNSVRFDGNQPSRPLQFEITHDRAREIDVAPTSVLVFSKVPAVAEARQEHADRQ